MCKNSREKMKKKTPLFGNPNRRIFKVQTPFKHHPTFHPQLFIYLLYSDKKSVTNTLN